MTLCLTNSCRKILGHTGQHDVYPSAPWAFMTTKDKDKLAKAGFATPRGGAKGAYQNHVLRSNRVIVPFERLNQAPLASYQDGYVIRIFPDQYFDALGQIKAVFNQAGAPQIGTNAFVLYRTHDQLDSVVTRYWPIERYTEHERLQGKTTGSWHNASQCRASA